jgi:uncharacterized protein (TIGR03437 family)
VLYERNGDTALKKIISKLIPCLLAGALPVALIAFSTGPPIKRTGAAVDGSLDCSACHRTFAPANSDPAGSVKIEAASYKPGASQIIRVTVQHPEALRWGFQLTARPVSDETKMAGTFTVEPNIRVRCDPDARDAPCGGALEFAEHTEPATHIGSNGSATFLIQWTPPATDVGEVVFYAAGNAANNNGAPSGDRIYTTSLKVSAERPCSLTKKPTIRGAVDAAGLKPGVAMNSLLTLFGSDFQATGGASRGVGNLDFVDGKFPKQLGCIAVEIAGQRAPILYVQPDQINAQIPTMTQTGNVTVQVILNPGLPGELKSDMATVTLQNYAPSFFTFNGTTVAALVAGTGTPVAIIAGIPGSRAAKPGEFVSIFGSGFGPTEPVYQSGEVIGAATLARLRDALTVTIGGTTVPGSDIQFAGIAPASISGLYQINVKIPATTPDGDIPVSVRIGGVDSPSGTTIPVKR